ncbi:MAG: hypothetical protein LBH87_01010 [Coriobacteriales bacterium]|jgi:hypothetical protein|nr:hypothetical protein [Coriobacteriales bacterium]
MPDVSTTATEVRKDFADFLDEARLRPQYIKRRSYQYIVLPAETFEKLTPDATVEVEFIEDEDGGIFTNNSFFPDVIGFGADKADALDSFKEGLISYSYEYYENFPIFSVSPGRAEQATAVLRLISHFERHANIDDLVKERAA